MIKKLTSLALAAMLVLSGINVYAYQPSLDFLNKVYSDSKMSNVETVSNVKFKLDKDIQIVDTLSEMVDKTEAGKFIDLKGFINGLFDSTLETEARQIINSKNKSAACEVKINSSNPIRINKNLELNVKSSFDIWAELGFKNENSYMNYVMAMPYANKYIVIDDEEFEKLYKSDDSADYMDSITGLVFDDKKQKELNSGMIESISKNGKVSGNNTNVTISFSDTGLKAYLADMLSLVMDFYDDETRKSIDESKVFDGLEKVCRQVKLFDEYTVNYKINSDGNIQSSDFILKVNTNAAEIMNALDSEYPGITKDNSNIAFTVTGSSQMKYNAASIKKPELTAENSMTLSEFAGLDQSGGDADYIPEEYYDDYFSLSFDGQVMTDENGVMIPLRALLENCGYEVGYDGGSITAVTESEIPKYKKIEIKIGSSTALTDGQDCAIGIEPKIVDDRAYVTKEAAEKLTDSVMDSYSYYAQDNGGWFNFKRK